MPSTLLLDDSDFGYHKVIAGNPTSEVSVVAIKVKRVYAQPAPSDGYRVLVDRLWPRGLSRDEARVDLWMRDVAPSTDLRKWYGHAPDKWPEFRERYENELEGHPDLVDLIRDLESHRTTVTLLFAARDEERNQAQVLAEVVRRRASR